MLTQRILIACALTAGIASAEDTGKLRVLVDPMSVGVFVEGKYAGPASKFSQKAGALTLPVGSHKVELMDPRYETVNANVQIEKDKVSTLRYKMKPKVVSDSGAPRGSLITTGFGNAAVYVNGQFYASASEIGSERGALRLPPGTYDLKVVNTDGSVAYEKPITLNAKEALVISKDGAPVRRPL